MEAAAYIVRSKAKTFILNDFQTIIPMVGRVSTVVVQRFCKPKVGGSNPSPGTILRPFRMLVGTLGGDLDVLSSGQDFWTGANRAFL
jgi:hypothetical protein